MPSNGDLMRRALKKHFLPELERCGFVGARNEFQRRGERLHLLSIHYWKYGGEFVLEAAQCERGDLKTTWGEVVPEASITVAHLSPLKRARLEQLGSKSGEHMRGFSFESFGADSAPYEALATHVASLLPQIDVWLANGEEGANLHVMGGSKTHAD